MTWTRLAANGIVSDVSQLNQIIDGLTGATTDQPITQVQSQQTVTETVLVSGVDPKAGTTVFCTLTANRVVGAPLSPVAGQQLHYVFTENGTGGWTLTFNAAFSITNWALNTAANARTELTVEYDGTASKWVVAVGSLTAPYGSASSVVVYPTGVNVQSLGADMSGVNASDAAWASAVAALPNGAGKIYVPPGIVKLASQQTLTSNLAIAGDGRGISTIKAAATLNVPMFNATVLAGGSIHDLTVRDLVFDGSLDLGASVRCFRIDTAANNAIPYYNLLFDGCSFRNAVVGMVHVASNAAGGPMNNALDVVASRFEDCQAGFVQGGTYGDHIRNCHFVRNTKHGIATVFGLFGWPTNEGGAGPTALTEITDCHFEGLGDFTTAGNVGSVGIAVTCSAVTISDIVISNMGSLALAYQDAEGYIPGMIHGVEMYGNGGGVALSVVNTAAAPYAGGVISDFTFCNVGFKTNWQGAFAPGLACPFWVDKGSWTISHGQIYGTVAIPPYGFYIGFDGDNVRRLTIQDVDVSGANFSSGMYYVYTPQTMDLQIKNCRGFNPMGVIASPPAVAATGVAVTNTKAVDCAIFVTAPSGVTVTAIAIAGTTITGLSVAPGTTSGAIRVYSGQTITLTYSGGTPTWQWFGD